MNSLLWFNKASRKTIFDQQQGGGTKRLQEDKEKDEDAGVLQFHDGIGLYGYLDYNPDTDEDDNEFGLSMFHINAPDGSEPAHISGQVMSSAVHLENVRCGDLAGKEKKGFMESYPHKCLHVMLSVLRSYFNDYDFTAHVDCSMPRLIAYYKSVGFEEEDECENDEQGTYVLMQASVSALPHVDVKLFNNPISNQTAKNDLKAKRIRQGSGTKQASFIQFLTK